jgi:hypothetical protein
MSALTGGTGGLHIDHLDINVAGHVLTDDSLTTSVYNGLLKLQRRNGKLGFK